MYQSINKVVLRRLFLVWLLLSVLIGGAVYALEMHKVDEVVLELVLRESKIFDQDDIDHIAAMDWSVVDDLNRKAQTLVDTHFSILDIYDQQTSHIVALSRFDSEHVEEVLESRHHKFPLDKRLHYEKFRVSGQLYAQVLLPLEASSGALAGYLEGVYHVDAQTLGEITGSVYRTLVLVLVTILAVSVALYPLILLLSRELYKFSSDLLRANMELMEVLGSAIAVRDSGTNEHNYRVTIYAIRLGEAYGLNDWQIRKLIAGAFLHDVGKIGVSDEILRKPDALTEDEHQQMREHVPLGLGIVSKAQWLQDAQEVIEFHHEKYDGSGYIYGLKGEKIPLNARIFAVVDVFDALTTKRPYKEAYEFEHAMEALREGRGTSFDPRVLGVFEQIAKPLYQQVAHADEDRLGEMLSELVRKYFFESRFHH